MKSWNIPQNPKVLIFDIDSTLYTCPEYAHEQIDSQVRHFAEINGMSHQQARNLISDFRKKWALEHDGQKISLGNLLTNFGISIETSIEWRKKLFDPYSFLSRDEQLINSLSLLKEKFYIICVTNNPVEPARKTLDAIGISPLISHIIGLDTLKKSKPAAEIFELALKTATTETNLDINFGDCISIGDRFDIDLALPLKLGCGAILVDGVKDVYTLPDFLSNLCH